MKKQLLTSVLAISMLHAPALEAQATATYWVAGAIANGVSKYLSQEMSSDLLHLQKGGDAHNLISLNLKSVYNSFLREFFGPRGKKYFPDAIILFEAEGQTSKSIAYESGRQALTLWEFFIIAQELTTEWQRTNIDQNQPSHDFSMPDAFLQTLYSAPDTIKTALIASAYFFVGYTIAALAKDVGAAARRTTSNLGPTKPIQENMLKFVETEPLKKIYENTFGIAAARLIKPLMLYYLREACQLLNLHQIEWDPVYEHAYRLGDKLIWSMAGFKSTAQLFTGPKSILASAQNNYDPSKHKAD